MVHNNKTEIKAGDKVKQDTQCGVHILFNTEKQADMWYRLHQKKCNICKPIKNEVVSLYTICTNCNR